MCPGGKDVVAEKGISVGENKGGDERVDIRGQNDSLTLFWVVVDGQDLCCKHVVLSSIDKGLRVTLKCRTVTSSLSGDRTLSHKFAMVVASVLKL